MLWALGVLLPISTRADYDKAFAVVRSIVNGWDPYSLISNGAPADEFDSSVAKVVAGIKAMKSSSAAAEGISRIFAEEFGEEGLSPSDCLGVAEELMSALGREGLL